MPEFQRHLQKALGASYSIERELGGGGMSRVFVAEETRLGRKVVIKLLAPEFAEGMSAERFEREIQLAAGLQEPHIVPLIAAGIADGLPYYTMPFIDGESLRARLVRGDIPLREAVSILEDVASALEYAHEHGVVHRDIKPENILLSKRAALVTDFGIAKAIAAARGPGADVALTGTGITLGTPAYMAPEQVAADPGIDQRADLYALGVVAYELFAGATPWAGRTPTQVVAAIMTEAPPLLSAARPDLPAALTTLVTRLLAKDPRARPANAAEVLRVLGEIARTDGNIERARPLALGGRGLRFVVAAGAALIVAVATYEIWSHTRKPAAQLAAADAFWAGGQSKSVAVFPFANTSGDTANEHFSDGLTDELISVLGRVPGLRVAARTSTFALKNKGLGVRAIADMLGVATVLEGSVRRVGGRIKATARLVKAANGESLWSGDYDRQTADVFGVQEEIAAAIVSALGAQPRGNAPTPLVGLPTRDLDAYELYLQGKYNAAVREKAHSAAAVMYFRRAIERDSQFALAFSALADVYVSASNFGFRPVGEALPSADAAADRAIALDPSLADAHASKGFVLASRGAFDAADTALRRAIQLNPSSVWAHHYYSLLLMMLGRADEAMRENSRALLLDPLSLPPNANRGVVLCLEGDRAGARRALRAALALNPDFALPLYYLGVVDAADGHFADAVTSLERAHAGAPSFPGVRSALGYVYTRLGRQADADTVLAALAGGGQDDRARIDRALGEAVMGHIDRAFATLGHSGWDIPSIINLRTNPLLAAFRQDSRYGPFLGQLGLKP